MTPLDEDIGRARALVIDGNSVSRSVLANMLSGFGVAAVTQARQPIQARQLLERYRFDIVVCDNDFEDAACNGRDLIDDLRIARILPLSTVVVMVSAEAGKAQVAAAAEAALDAYLLKPHTSDALRSRLLQSRSRKRELKDVIAMIDRREFEQAARICQERFESRGPAWLQAARIGAELWLRLGNPQAAQSLFEAILQVGAVPWAKLGVARALRDRGITNEARRSLESLLSEQPGYTDAYDVMARVLLDQGQPDLALAASREALALTPGCVARLVKHGLLAFFYGDAGEARNALAQAARCGMNSQVFDLQGLVLLALVQFDAADLSGLAVTMRHITTVRSEHPDSHRLRRFEAVIGILKHLLERQVPEAVASAREMIAEMREPSFDIEAACNLLTLITRLTRREIRLPEIADDVRVLARRFAVSRMTCELLVRSLQDEARLPVVVQQAYESICHQAEAAVSHTVEGCPSKAVQHLLDCAEATLNARLIELALHTMERHGNDIDGLTELQDRAASLNRRYRSYGAQVNLNGNFSPPTKIAPP